MSEDRRAGSGRGWSAASVGIGLLVFGLYAITGPGRIDMIDGQIRYEAAVRWLQEGRPLIRIPPCFTPRSKVAGATGTAVTVWAPP